MKCIDDEERQEKLKKAKLLRIVNGLQMTHIIPQKDAFIVTFQKKYTATKINDGDSVHL